MSFQRSMRRVKKSAIVGGARAHQCFVSIHNLKAIEEFQNFFGHRANVRSNFIRGLGDVSFRSTHNPGTDEARNQVRVKHTVRVGRLVR